MSKILEDALFLEEIGDKLEEFGLVRDEALAYLLNKLQEDAICWERKIKIMRMFAAKVQESFEAK